jgi:hypothetical protein
VWRIDDGQTVALLRGLPGPVFFPVRLLSTIYVDLFRALPGVLVIFILGLGIPALRIEGVPNDPFFWGAYVMAPWCNRVVPEPIEVGGRTVALGPNFRDGTAIHGQVYASPWTVDGDGRYTIRAAS